MLNTKSQAQTIVGTPYYLSPEMCEGSDYNEKSDIWALGCIFYELAILKKPFSAQTLPVLIQKIVETYCPTESSYTTETSEKITWWTNNTTENEIVTSVPPCINALTGNLATRLCQNSTWIPKVPPECSRVFETDGFCPSKSYFSEKSDDDLCTFLTDPKNGNYECTATDVSENYVKNSLVWLPVRRKTKYGPYESTTLGKTYGQAIESKLLLDDSYNIIDIFNQNCVTVNETSEELSPTDCDAELHPHFCQITKDFNQVSCPKDCYISGFAKNICYCRVTSTFCDEYPGSISTPYEKEILEKLADNSACSIAKHSEYIEFIGLDAWFLSTNFEFNCSICAVRAIKLDKIDPPELVLAFDDAKRKLYLTIYNQNHIYNSNDTDYIYCFTNAAKESLKKRVEVSKIFESCNFFVVYSLELEQHIGNYWCEVSLISLGSSDFVSSNVAVAYETKNGNEFVARFLIQGICNFTHCHVETDGSVDFESFLIEDIADILEPFDIDLRVMEVFNFDVQQNFVDILVHFSSNERLNVVGEFYKIINNLLYRLPSYVTLKYFLSSEFCMPETSKYELTWPLGKFHECVISTHKICLLENLEPLYRVCEGDFLYGLKWSEIDGGCSKYVFFSSVTEELQNIYEKEGQVTGADIENVSIVLDQTEKENLSVLDVYFVSKILEKAEFTVEFGILNNSAQVVSSLMEIKEDQRILEDAQNSFNATDTILHAIEDMLEAFSNDTLVIQSENVLVYSFSPFLSNITGLVVYANHSYESIKRGSVMNFNDNVELVLFLPEELLLDTLFQNVTVIVTVYFNDKLFVDHQNYTAELVVNVNFFNAQDSIVFLPISLPVLFKKRAGNISSCAFWDYGTKHIRRKGKWAFTGSSSVGKIENSSLEMCSFSHLTHFAKLVLQNDSFLLASTTTHENILSILTITGGILSIFGVTAIFLTAIIHEKWRKRSGTKILMHLCVAIMLEVIILHLVEMNIPNYLTCQIIGIVMHYIVLSKFCWVLIYAVLQYIRFVKVLNTRPKHLVLRSVIFGWGFAVFPVSIVAILTPETYTNENYHFCYPTDISLFLGVMLPILLVIFVNIYIFCLVMYQVSYKSIENSNKSTDNSAVLQMKLATLLFFVFGIPWLFGISANLFEASWFATFLVYMFCLTSTVQGFVLFLFYVVFNRETRVRWKVFFVKDCCLNCAKKK